MSSLAPRLLRVAIVGRPNVGKSALFNRLAGASLAIVDPTSGTTRDRLHTTVEWNNKIFELIDTGGLVRDPQQLQAHIARQVAAALDQADLILFVTDAIAGRTPLDDYVSDHLRSLNKPVWLVVNKCDNPDLRLAWTDFAAYAWPQSFTVSATHGIGINALLDALANQAAAAEIPHFTPGPALAIVGRPNAGKSSLLNRLLGEERSIVTDIPGTTRDTIDALLPWQLPSRAGLSPFVITLIDTAGIRRKRAISSTLEAHSVRRAEAAINRASVAVLLIDAQSGVSVTDKKIAATINDAGRACVIAINKWDLVKKHVDKRAFTQWVRQQLPFLSYAPITCISALTGEGVHDLVNRACRVDAAARRSHPTSKLNRVLHDAFAANAPPLVHGRRLHLFYATQCGTLPPRFVLFVNDPRLVVHSYENYLVNQLRQAFHYEGTPLFLAWRPRRESN
ncbi:MAG: ribosome biogenesis GTPase Der [bacterium]|nr:ribosome biogenesis GTPase Der [bacterium]